MTEFRKHQALLFWNPGALPGRGLDHDVLTGPGPAGDDESAAESVWDRGDLLSLLNENLLAEPPHDSAEVRR